MRNDLSLAAILREKKIQSAIVCGHGIQGWCRSSMTTLVEVRLPQSTVKSFLPRIIDLHKLFYYQTCFGLQNVDKKLHNFDFESPAFRSNIDLVYIVKTYQLHL